MEETREAIYNRLMEAVHCNAGYALIDACQEIKVVGGILKNERRMAEEARQERKDLLEQIETLRAEALGWHHEVVVLRGKVQRLIFLLIGLGEKCGISGEEILGKLYEAFTPSQPPPFSSKMEEGKERGEGDDVV